MSSTRPFLSPVDARHIDPKGRYEEAVHNPFHLWECCFLRTWGLPPPTPLRWNGVWTSYEWDAFIMGSVIICYVRKQRFPAGGIISSC